MSWYKRQPGRVASKTLLACAITALALVAWPAVASGANGDNLRTITADTSGTACPSLGVGIAFDGTNLLVSCYSDNSVVAVSPVNGAQAFAGVHFITGAQTLGALAWDNGRKLLWACSGYDGYVGTIDLTTNVFTPAFLSTGCFDGLAYDSSDDSLWTSPDATNTITHYSTTGAVLGGPFFPSLPCGNSGIAVGGPLLYLATDGCSSIYTSDKAFSTAPTFFASFPARLEDMECDNVTFAPLGAIWSKDAYDNTLNAWEIPAGTCAFGGGGPAQGEDLTVTKTADPSFTRAYGWSITKSVDQTKIVSATSGTFNYTVSVSHDSGTDSAWQVTGSITVSNPNSSDVTADVTDAVDNGGTCTVTGGTGVTVPASDSVTLPYTCTYSSAPSPSNGTNTATATWDGASLGSPDSSATGTAAFAFTSPTSTVDGSVSVTDSLTGALGSVFAADPSPTTFAYSLTFPAPTSGCASHSNTASFTTSDTSTTGSASQTVQVCYPVRPLTAGYWKNHQAQTMALLGGIKLGGWTVGTWARVTAVFNAMNCSSSTSQNAIGCLAGQLLAAKLNLANGSDWCIKPFVNSANSLLSGLPYTGPTGNYSSISSATRSGAISLKTKLDTYNNGGGC